MAGVHARAITLNILQLHPWDVSLQEASAIQSDLASRVSRTSTVPERPRFIAGMDLSPPDSDGVTRGAVVVMSISDLEVVEVKRSEGVPPFPYVPGYLSFRESPVLLGALEKLTVTPDLVLIDGQGLAHPRRFGIACHVGVLADLPTIGCAKSILRGKHAPLGSERGSWSYLMDKHEVVGAALRTRDKVSPVYISIGHKVDLDTAMRYVLASSKGYRMPEPTRLAHQAAAVSCPPREPVAGPARSRMELN